MAVRLIDANTLRAEFTGNFRELWHYTGIWATIDVAPTIDPESLRPHGKWIETVEELGWQDVTCYKCSVCGESWVLDEEWSIEEIMESHNYCPNCGAKMDKEE